ncbi:hypothetical protein GCM10028794_28490 [Silanimonas algicola]
MRIFVLSALALLTACSSPDHQAQSSDSSTNEQGSAKEAETASTWTLTERKDELTDESIVVATNRGERETGVGDPPLLFARCTDGDLEAFIDLDEFLNSDDPVPVRYRFDKGPLTERSWGVSTTGASVFVEWREVADFLRAVASSRQLIFEADNYRDVSYRAKFTLEGGAEKIAKVLASCGRDLQPLTDRVPGLRPDMAVDVETLGPVQIATFKEVLASHGKYSGAIDAELTPEFALAAQTFYDEYIAICKAQGPTTLRAQRPGEIFCSSLDESLPPSVGMAFYARSDGELKQRVGDLRRGD